MADLDWTKAKILSKDGKTTSLTEQPDLDWSSAEVRDKPTIAGDFVSGIKSGTDSLQSGLYGAGAALANKAGAKGVRDYMEEGMLRNNEEAQQNQVSVQSYKDVNGVGDALHYAAGGVGQLVPFMGQSIVSGVAGRKLGGKLKLNKQLASEGASLLSNTATETGSIYGDILEKTGERDSDKAFGYGLAAGSLDTLSERGLLGKLGGVSAGTGSLGKRVAKEGVKQFGKEAATESAQTAIERAAVADVDPSHKIFSPEGVEEIVNAGIIGGIGGGIMGGGSELLTNRPAADNSVPPEQDLPTDTTEPPVQPTPEPPVSGGAPNIAPENQTPPANPVEAHVQKKVQEAANVNPDNGVLSKAVNMGVQTGAIEDKAREEAVSIIGEQAAEPVIETQEIPAPKAPVGKRDYTDDELVELTKTQFRSGNKVTSDAISRATGVDIERAARARELAKIKIAEENSLAAKELDGVEFKSFTAAKAVLVNSGLQDTHTAWSAGNGSYIIKPREEVKNEVKNQEKLQAAVEKRSEKIESEQEETTDASGNVPLNNNVDGYNIDADNARRQRELDILGAEKPQTQQTQTNTVNDASNTGESQQPLLPSAPVNSGEQAENDSGDAIEVISEKGMRVNAPIEKIREILGEKVSLPPNKKGGYTVSRKYEEKLRAGLSASKDSQQQETLPPVAKGDAKPKAPVSPNITLISSNDKGQDEDLKKHKRDVFVYKNKLKKSATPEEKAKYEGMLKTSEERLRKARQSIFNVEQMISSGAKTLPDDLVDVFPSVQKAISESVTTNEKALTEEKVVKPESSGESIATNEKALTEEKVVKPESSGRDSYPTMISAKFNMKKLGLEETHRVVFNNKDNTFSIIEKPEAGKQVANEPSDSGSSEDFVSKKTAETVAKAESRYPEADRSLFTIPKNIAKTMDINIDGMSEKERNKAVSDAISHGEYLYDLKASAQYIINSDLIPIEKANALSQAIVVAGDANNKSLSATQKSIRVMEKAIESAGLDIDSILDSYGDFGHRSDSFADGVLIGNTAFNTGESAPAKGSVTAKTQKQPEAKSEKSDDKQSEPVKKIPLLEGDIFRTVTGRETTPFPKTGFKVMKRNEVAVRSWLKENALAEAESRGDTFNATIFNNLNVHNWSQSDGDGVNLYLFNDAEGRIGRFKIELTDAEKRANEAKDLLRQYKALAHDKSAQKKLNAKVRALAKRTPADESLTVLAIDIFVTRSGMSDPVYAEPLSNTEKPSDLKPIQNPETKQEPVINSAPEPIVDNKPPVSDNKVFTEDAAEKAREILRKKMGTLRSGLDPEMAVAGATLAGYHIEKGARTIAAYSKAMVEDMGEWIKPYLKSWYMSVKYDPRAAGFDGMSSAEEVEKFDVESIATKESVNAESKLDKSSEGALGGTQTNDVLEAEKGGKSGESSGASGENDSTGDGAADGERSGIPRGLGEGKGDLPVSTRRRRSKRDSGQRDIFADEGITSTEERDSEPVKPPKASAPTVDYKITEEFALGEGGAKTKFKNNIEAIKTLKSLQETGDKATKQEQDIMARYVGWGGLSQAFDEKNSDWSKEYAELKEILTDDEYSAAAQSTQYAHYTSREIIKGMYDAVKHIGFSGGNILEAGMGVGNFLGLMPDSLRGGSRFTGVEREIISSGIAQQLYPNQNIQRADFGAWAGQKGYFDLAIGNPPFSNTKIHDKTGEKHLNGLSIHNYFFAKSVDQLREGGILAMVVTNSFMDSKRDNARKYISDRTEFLGAIRLPNNAFSENAMTQVTTDIVFLKKRPDSEFGSRKTISEGKVWMDVTEITGEDGRKIPLNNYFAENPHMMLGKMTLQGTMYRKDSPALVANDGQNTAQLMQYAISKLPKGVYSSAEVDTKTLEDRAIERMRDIDVQVGGYFVKDGDLYQRESDIAGQQRAGKLTPNTKWTEKTVLGVKRYNQLKDLYQLRTTMRKLIDSEVSGDEKAMTAYRKDLNEQYDSYVKANGLINSTPTIQVFGDDPDYPLLASLEHGYDKGIGAAAAKTAGIKPVKPSAKKSPIFSQVVTGKRKSVEKAETPVDALLVSLAERGKIDVNYIGEMLGVDGEKALSELVNSDNPEVFVDPSSGEYVLRDEYLSGNVRKKLKAAEAAGLPVHIEALKKVLPKDKGVSEISANFGAPWVAPKFYEEFITKLIGGTAKVSYNSVAASYSTDLNPDNEVANKNTYGIPEYPATSIFDALLNHRSIKIGHYDQDKKFILNTERTQAANDKGQDIKDAFRDWLFSDSDRAEELIRSYNDTHNNFVDRDYDGKLLTFSGKVPDSIIQLRKHQINAVWRVVQDRTALLDHVVGSGKTFTVIAAAMELKRTGLSKKPMITVPNHLVKQWAADFYRLYPAANILTVTKKDFNRESRRKFLAKVATGDWDAVIISHSSFGFIQPDPDFESRLINEEIEEITRSLKELSEKNGDKVTVKRLENMKEKLENRIAKLLDRPMDDLLDFGQLGVDQLFVDEAHLFKNLMYSTKIQGVSGMGDGSGSQRALNMFVKAQQIFAKNGKDQGVVFATGTPVSNSMAEMYHMQRYLQPTAMKDAGLWSFDAWADTFAEIEQVTMQSPAGNGYKVASRMKFMNVNSLLQMNRQVTDTVTNEQVKADFRVKNGYEFPIPTLKTGKRIPVSIPLSPEQTEEMENIADRAAALENSKGRPKAGEDNILSIMTTGRKVAMDVRLVRTDITERPKGGKVETAGERMMEVYREFSKVRGTQLVFSDMSTPIKTAKKELKEYEELMGLVNAATESVRADAVLGDEKAGDIVEKAEAAQSALEQKGDDWQSAVEAAIRGFSIYDDLKSYLIENGVPEHEIAFIHDYNTDDQKATLFSAVNSGKIRFLFGSTAKLGAGTNVQERLVALHHLDVPWKPSDIEQREGRIIRQGNKLFGDTNPKNPNEERIEGFEPSIFAYVTQDTLEFRMWQIQERKLAMIEQLRTGDVEDEMDDAFADVTMSASEMQAAATSNPYMLQEVEIKDAIKKLERKQKSFQSQKIELASVLKRARRDVERLPAEIEKYEAFKKSDDKYASETKALEQSFEITINGEVYTDRRLAKHTLGSLTYTEEKGEKMSPININGKEYTSKTAVADAFVSIAGDEETIVFKSKSGETLTSRAAIRQDISPEIAKAVATASEVSIGALGDIDFSIEVEKDPRNREYYVAQIIGKTGGYEYHNEINLKGLAGAEAAIIKGMTSITYGSTRRLEYANESLKSAEKIIVDAEKAGDLGDFPEVERLNTLREKLKVVTEKLIAFAAEKEAERVKSRKGGNAKDLDLSHSAMKDSPEILFSRAGYSFNAEDSPFYMERSESDVNFVSKADADKALATDAVAKKIMAKNSVIKDGDLVGVRLNINVLKNTGVPVQAIHSGSPAIRKKMLDNPKLGSGFYNGSVLAYANAVNLKNANFTVHQNQREKIASGISSKTPMASVDGHYAEGEPNLNGVEFRFNPHREHLFIDKYGRAIRSAEDVTIMGNSVFARGEIEYFDADTMPDKAGESPTSATMFNPQLPFSGNPVFRRGVGGNSVASVRNVVKSISSNWKNAPKITVVQSVSDLPFTAPKDAAGAFYRDEVYMVADNIKNRDHAEFVLLHESLGHYGLAGVLGDSIKPALRNIYHSNKDIRALADKYIERNPESRLELAVEEVLADLAGAKKLSEVRGLDKVFAAFRNALRRLGFKIELSNNDISYLMQTARRFVTESSTTVGDTNSFMRGWYETRFKKAYHGSPHAFDKFSLLAIGTGEGVQAFGWGLYFAGKKSVAEWYRDTLTPNARLFVDGKRYTDGVLPDSSPEAKALRLVAYQAQSYDTGDVRNPSEAKKEALRVFQENIDAIKDEIDQYQSAKKLSKQDELYLKDYLLQQLADDNVILDALKKIDVSRVSFKRGNLYQVDIPEENELLDHNERLSKQPDHVKKILLSKGVSKKLAARDSHADVIQSMIDGDATGGAIYAAIEAGYENRDNNQKGDKAASLALNSVGIKGLRYLNEDSRHLGVQKWLVNGKSMNDVSGDEFTDSYADGYAIDNIFQRLESGEKLADIELSFSRGDYSSDVKRIFDKLEFESPELTHNYVIWDDSVISVEAVNDEIAQAQEIAEDKKFSVNKTDIESGTALPPSFNRWFNGSKMVDENGNPMHLYHGTVDNFTVFDLNHKNRADSGWLGTGVYLTTSKELAGSNAFRKLFKKKDRTKETKTIVMDLYANIKNPYTATNEDKARLKSISDRYGIDAGRAAADEFTSKLKAKGHDGVILDLDGHKEVVVFNPANIKSATDNNGNFDGSNEDIRFSTLDSLYQNGHVRNIQQNLTDRFTKVKGFSAWDRTVGTQFHKAWKNKDFKRVFDDGQNYLNDVSRFAMEAADQAPDLLPKVEVGSIINTVKNYKTNQKDQKAISAPVYQGTLTYVRDSFTGKPREAKEGESAGIVFTDSELSTMFNLNKRQIGLYRQFRKAIDQSLEGVGVSEAARELKKFNLFHRVLSEAKYNPSEAMTLILNDVRFKAEELESSGLMEDKQLANELRKTLAGLNVKHEKIESLKRGGYAPLMRFGEYAVTVKDAEGNVKYFELFESKSEMLQRHRDMKETFPKDNVTYGVMNDERYKLFKDVSPDSLELFAEAIGADKSEVFQDYLRLAKNNRSALKRLIQRKGTAGYSKEVTRTLAQFVTSNARHSSSNYHMGEMERNVRDVEAGDIQKEAVRLLEYVKNPTEEAAGLRGYLFINFIGGSIASAMVNMTQPVTMTYPYLAQWGAKKAAMYLSEGAKVAATGKTNNKRLAAAMQRAKEEGIVAPHEIHQLHAEAIQGFGRNPLVRAALTTWGTPFSLAESFNRRITFAAAFNIAEQMTSEERKKAGVVSSYHFAANAVYETQGVYNRGNRPNWARGAIGATIFTFKQFSIAYIEFLGRLPPKERIIALGILVLFSGLQGLPAAEDAEDIIDTVAQGLGYNFDSKKELRDAIMSAFVAVLGQDAGAFMAGLATHGVSSFTPIDIQARMSMGNLIPATGAMKRSSNNKGKEIFDAFGAAGGLANNLLEGATKVLAGDVVNGFLKMSPLAMQNAAKGLNAIITDEYRDGRGKKITHATNAEGAWKAIGFQPARIANESRLATSEYQNISMVRSEEAAIVDEWSKGISSKDKNMVESAKKRLQDWNRKNPETPIRVTPNQIKSRVKGLKADRIQRILKTAPKELRSAARARLMAGE